MPWFLSPDCDLEWQGWLDDLNSQVIPGASVHLAPLQFRLWPCLGCPGWDRGAGHLPHETEGQPEQQEAGKQVASHPIWDTSQCYLPHTEARIFEVNEIGPMWEELHHILTHKFFISPNYSSTHPKVCSAYLTLLCPPKSPISYRPNSNALFSLEPSLIHTSQNEQCSLPCAHQHVLCYVVRRVLQELCYPLPLPYPHDWSMPHPRWAPVASEQKRQCDITVVLTWDSMPYHLDHTWSRLKLHGADWIMWARNHWACGGLVQGLT